MSQETTIQHTEAPASFTVKMVHPAGFDCMLTLRGNSGAEVLPKAEAAITWATEHGYTPTMAPARASTNGNGHTAKTETPAADVLTDDQGKRYRVCSEHQARMYEKTGKGGQTWYSHQLADGEWCKGKKSE